MKESLPYPVLSGPVAGLALLIAGIVGVGFLAYDLGERVGYAKEGLAQRAVHPPAPKPPPAKER
ncbi:hypothetical protein BN873_p60021 [Candidatus Competibacter denitrificans Run_A_D11]|uniref:Uncharacterized protein n=1 Tax=Candidatus Competibacter denitrificans Run_A_D11 TaxID=1400863 RepID=W6M9S1_9GAMM|nr:hypothetical protein [Candidatus Competibacter denitrificans]CDI04761.1 hypothetical protein BN873_p60021 [Candidatus Competibacter denitrificans Run_A_D11]HCK79859.1 hypothetical protein [Candidatus Competibacteraceae bacterium]